MTESNQSSYLPQPRVSVVIPAYRASTYIADALQSVFAQTFHEFEVVVVNDGSPDTPELEQALRPFASRIRYMKQANRGVSAARNVGIQHSRGSYVALLDSDDIWLPEYLEAQVEFLDQNPRAVGVVSDVIYFGELAKVDILQQWLRPGMTQLFTFEDMIRRKAGQLPSATVYRREEAINAGLYDEELRLGEDIEFSMRICFPEGVVGYSGRALAKYRRHSAGAAGNLSRQDITKNEAICLRRLGTKLPLTSAQRALLDLEIATLEAELAMMNAYDDLARREFDRAANSLAQANRHYRDKRIALATLALKFFPSWTARVLLYRKGFHQATAEKA